MSSPILYKGLTYPSLKKLVESEANDGLSYSVVMGRIKIGWDLDEALGKPRNKNVRKYTINNKEFASLKDLAEEAGISYEAAVKRSHRGWSDEEIFYGRTKPEKIKIVKAKKSRGKPVFVDGKEYENLTDAFNSLNPNCTLNTLRARLRERWSLEEALEVKLKIDGRKSTANTKKLTIDGVALSVAEAVNRYSVPSSTILYRLNRGATSEQAVGLEDIERGALLSQPEDNRDRKKREKKTYVVDGVFYSSVAELARAYELSPALVYNRIRDNGWTPERAVKEDTTEVVEVRGIRYRSSQNAWDEIGKTNFAVYQARKTLGHSLEVCLGLEPLPSIERYELNGKTYGSLSEVAKENDLSVGQLTSRLKNMSLEEAVIYKPSNGRYSESVFEKDPELANTLATLYFIRVALTDGILQKVGITQKETSQRFRSHNIEIITEVKGKLRDLYELEQLIISEFSELHYRAEDEFEGRTETFLLMEEEEKEILNFISGHLNHFGLAGNKPNNSSKMDT